jgi:hypothetical protein
VLLSVIAGPLFPNDDARTMKLLVHAIPDTPAKHDASSWIHDIFPAQESE